MDELLMPFTGHSAEDLRTTLQSIADSPLPVELFDAFLFDYVKTKDLGEARFFAACCYNQDRTKKQNPKVKDVSDVFSSAD